MDDAIGKALRAAATHNCICYGECFETRHGMMNGPCEAELGPTAAAIAAFLEEFRRQFPQREPWDEATFEPSALAAAIRALPLPPRPTLED